MFSDTHAMEGVMAEKVSLEVIFKDWCVCEVVVVGFILIEWIILWARGLTFLMAEKEEELKSVLIKVKEESEKAGLHVNNNKKN